MQAVVDYTKRILQPYLNWSNCSADFRNKYSELQKGGHLGYLTKTNREGFTQGDWYSLPRTKRIRLVNATFPPDVLGWKTDEELISSVDSSIWFYKHYNMNQVDGYIHQWHRFPWMGMIAFYYYKILKGYC